MRRPADTSPDLRRRQIAAYRAMTPARRLQLADSMSTEVRALAAAGRRARAATASDRDDEAAQPPTGTR